jgi:hypothetical protein
MKSMPEKNPNQLKPADDKRFTKHSSTGRSPTAGEIHPFSGEIILDKEN